ncbi:transposase [Labrys neptuniae]|uniref:Transposase n=1 Tax=Labrys neptuniae TaxID=376174 RepID=A0ABV3PWB3_9HYPH
MLSHWAPFPPAQHFRRSRTVARTDPARAGRGPGWLRSSGGQEWALWVTLTAAGIRAVQLPPAQIKAFALSRDTRAKTDRIDAELIAGFMLLRPEAGRALPSGNLRVLRALTTRRAQIVDMRKRLVAQISAREKQGVVADVGDMDIDIALKTMLYDQIGALERRIENAIAQEECLAAKARLLRSIPGVGPISAAMLIAEMPELGRMTAGQAAAMTGLAPVPHDSGTMRGRRMIVGGRRALRHVLFQAALAAACHNAGLRPLAKRLKERGRPISSSSSQLHASWSQSQMPSLKQRLHGA